MTTPTTPPSAWRLQLSLRTLFGGIFVLGVCFGWMADHLHQGRVREQQFRTLHALHNERLVKLEEELIAMRQGNPGQWIPPELTAVVRRGAVITTSPISATIAFPDASDDDLGGTVRASTITNVSLADGRFTPKGLAQLRQLPRLETLSLRGPWCNGDCLAQLAELKQLHSLRLGEARLEYGALAPVGRLPNLRLLSIYHTPVTDSELIYLSSLEGLEILSLQDVEIGDEALAHLKYLRKLQTLSLMKARVSDAGLVHLQSLEELSDLRLRETAITDAGLLQLASMKRLRQLDVAGTNVTEAGVVEFKKRAPKCWVTYANGRRM